LAKGLQFGFQAVAGLIIGFVKGWRLALVIIAVSPLVRSPVELLSNLSRLLLEVSLL
jgi:hypothetical protein